jgi:Abnormal spindle-like microcephaly-assoc'd, ASPM-SPD-2-Hydin
MRAVIFLAAILFARCEAQTGVQYIPSQNGYFGISFSSTEVTTEDCGSGPVTSSQTSTYTSPVETDPYNLVLYAMGGNTDAVTNVFTVASGNSLFQGSSTGQAQVDIGGPPSTFTISVNGVGIAGTVATPIAYEGEIFPSGPTEGQIIGTITETDSYDIVSGSDSVTFSGSDAYSFVNGSCSYNISDTSSGGGSATWPIISSGPLMITTTSPLPDGIVEEQYPSVTMQASGGVPFSDGTYNWTFTGLPSGLTFSSSGTISGIPTESNIGFGDPLPSYLLPFEVFATVTDSVGGQTQGQFSLSVSDEPQVIQPKSLSDRSAYAQQATVYSADAAALAFVLFNPEARAACALVPACLPGVESMFTTYTGLAAEYWALAVDPADPNYMVIAVPVYPPPSSFSLKQGFTKAEINAAAALFSNLSKQAGLLNAMITSINRAQGAAAAANMYWENKQLLAARSYALQLSTFVSNQSTLTSTFVNALQAAGFPSLQVTTAALSSFQEQIQSSGMPPQLPQALSQELSQAGIDAVSINLFAWMVAELPISSGVGTYPSALASTNLTSSSTQVVAALKEFAAPPPTISPTRLNFGNVTLSQRKKEVVTVQNTGAVKVEIRAISFTNIVGNPADFSFHQYCQANLLPGKSCTVGVFFSPDSLTTDTATLNIVTNAPGSPLQVPITATGISKK